MQQGWQRLRGRWPAAELGLLRAAHALQLARLRAEALMARLRGGSAQPRIAVTACWRFPIYSQTFVQQEAAALALAGFPLRFFHAQTNPRGELAHPCAVLWRLKRRLVLHRLTGADDLAHYRARHPDRVAAVLAALAAETGLDEAALLAHEHVLHAFSFTRAVEAWRADYVHSYFFYEQSLFAWVASTLLRLPRGVSCYADHLLQDYALKAVRLQLRDCRVIVATSRRIGAELEGLHGGPLPSLLVKPNAIDTRSFPDRDPDNEAGQETLHLLSVSRLDPKKGLEHLIDAVGLLRAGGLAVQLRIVGAHDPASAEGAAYAAWLQHQATAPAVAGAVHFLGRRDSRQIRDELRRADAFVAPFVELPNGDKDGIPTAVLEAMAAGCAIVATDAGSMAEIVDPGREALVVPQRDAPALAGALERLHRDPALARALGRAAAARARAEFDIARCELPLHAAVRAAVAAEAGR